MFKVEIKFNSNNDAVVEKTNKIFTMRNLSFQHKSSEVYVYVGNGSKNDYGYFWAAFFDLKKAKWFIKNVSECTWFDGELKKDLLEGFFKV